MDTCTDGLQILVADDDPDIRGLVALVLGRAGYRISTANDGLEAYALARERAWDLLLLDVSMPGMDGYAVCRELQAASSTPPPVIFLTANDHTSARVAGLDAGAVDYVVKPFDAAELTARVRAALRTKAVTDQLAAEAATDSLTGLLNRSQLHLRAAEAVAISARHGRPLACLMIDVDHFKRINDTFGHAAGDAVLVEVARRLRRACRASDVAVRYGGEEFVLLLPETGAEGARVTAEKIRSVIAAEPVSFSEAFVPGGPARAGDVLEIPVRVSIGGACFAERMDGSSALLAVADKALYRAKQLGRNRIEFATEED